MIGRIALYSVFLISVVSLLVVFVVIKQVSIFMDESLPARTLTPGSLTTETWGIFNPNTGDVITGNNIDGQRPIASLTKLFTAVAVMESDKRYEGFSIAFSDVSTEGRAGKLVYGEWMTPYELLFPLLIESSNDAGEAIRRKLGDAYTESIASTTSNLSLAGTHLNDASGLSPGDVSTVRDLSAFYTYLKKRHPHIIDITQLTMYVSSRTGYINNNPARSLKNFTGGKNGYTPEAQRTFVGTFVLEDSKTEVGIILLGSSDILKDIQTLLSFNEGGTKQF